MWYLRVSNVRDSDNLLRMMDTLDTSCMSVCVWVSACRNIAPALELRFDLLSFNELDLCGPLQHEHSDAHLF